MLFYLIQTNFVDIALVLFLYIFLLTGTTLEKGQLRIFITATVILNIIIFADMTDYYLSTLGEVHMLRYITSATGYALRPAAIYFMVLIARSFDKKKAAIFAIPLVINAFLAFASTFNHNMFYFDESNIFHRGVFGFIPFIISGIYLAVLLVTSFNKYRIGNKLEAAVVIFIAVMSVTAVCMETFFHFKFIINGVGGASIIFYYAFLNTQTYKRDALTKALNRHSFYTDSERMAKKNMIVVSIDLNNLKQINDNEGHDAGDTAICTVANTIFINIPIWYSLYRMGGDEFALLCPGASVDSVETMMKKIIDGVKMKGYSLAWGSAQYEAGMNFDEVLALSDERMYENKRLSKQEAM